MPDLPEALPHGPLEELLPDVYIVRGSISVAPLVRIPRNMIVVREDGALTLINPVRLSPDGEASLERLGSVKHAVRLGFFHQRDDAYTRQRWQPTFWSAAPGAEGARPLVDGGESPISRARVFAFQTASKGEAALIVDGPGGKVLVTCDSVQHWADATGCSLMGALATRVLGFLKRPATIGPLWAKEMTGGHPKVLAPDFERLLKLDFMHLVSAHGSMLRDTAHAELARSFEAMTSAS